MKLKTVIKLLDTSLGGGHYIENDYCYYHIPSDSMSTLVTLCGADMDYKELEITANTIPNCPHCISVLKYCKNLKIPK